VELPWAGIPSIRITNMLQLATPTQLMRISKDRWISGEIDQRSYCQRKVKWIRKQPEGAGQETEASVTTAAVKPAVAPKEKGKGKKGSATDATGKYDINALKKGLLEKGMPESLLNCFHRATC